VWRQLCLWVLLIMLDETPRKSIFAAAQNKWAEVDIGFLLILSLNQANFSLNICIMKNRPCGPWMAICFVSFFRICSNVYIDLDVKCLLWVITPLHRFRLRLFMRCSIALKTFDLLDKILIAHHCCAIMQWRVQYSWHIIFPPKWSHITLFNY